MDIHLMVIEKHGSYVLRYTESEYLEVYGALQRKILATGAVLTEKDYRVVNMNVLATQRLNGVL